MKLSERLRDIMEVEPYSGFYPKITVTPELIKEIENLEEKAKELDLLTNYG